MEFEVVTTGACDLGHHLAWDEQARRMKALSVDLGERSYTIHIGTQLLDQPELFSPHLAGGAVCIVTDDKVAPLYLNQLKNTLSEFEHCSMILPHGEQHKHWQSLDRVFSFLLKNEVGRDGTLVASVAQEGLVRLRRQT